eukprot:3949412-Alexandrium_andersonii.AAC.1
MLRTAAVGSLARRQAALAVTLRPLAWARPAVRPRATSSCGAKTRWRACHDLRPSILVAVAAAAARR